MDVVLVNKLRNDQAYTILIYKAGCMCFGESVSTHHLSSVNCLSVTKGLTKGLTVANSGTNFGKLWD